MQSFLSLFRAPSPAPTSVILSEGPPPLSGILSTANPNTVALYSTDYVGGKGGSLLRLRGARLNVPSFFIVPVEEFELALERAAARSGASLSKWLEGEDFGGENVKLAKALEEVQLSDEIHTMIKAFVGSDPKRAFAVRSSATVEDGADSAFAGQFVTKLNVHGVEHVEMAIKECWKSLISDSVKPYYKSKLVTKPRMAVVVQEQIQSRVAGVYFQANPVTGSKATHVISAAFGQGEGVVSGTASIDEFWLNAETGKMTKSVLSEKTKRIALADVADGVREEAMPAEFQKLPALTEENIKALFEASTRIAKSYISPQDIEFAFDEKNQLFILQARPITTYLESLTISPPDVGLWRLNAHVAAPMSALYDPIWCDGWSRGVMYNSKLTGSGMTACDTFSANGFGYFCLRFPGPKKPPTAPPPKFLMKMILSLTGGKDTAAAKKFWDTKSYLQFAQEFETKYKPEWIQKHRVLQLAGAAVKTKDEAVAHLERCHQHMIEAWYAHVTYTMQNLCPVAWFVVQAKAWTKCSDAEAFGALEGFSPVTRGLKGEFFDQIKLLKESGEAQEFFNASNAEQASANLAKLRKLAGPAGLAADAICTNMESRLMEGYDVANPIIKENPLFLLTAIKFAVQTFETIIEPVGDKIAAILLGSVPNKHKAEFKALLDETRQIVRLRDERAIYTDLWAAGILHEAVVICSKFADHNTERTAPGASGLTLTRLMLEGNLGEIKDATLNGVTPQMIQTWKERKKHRETASIRDMPDLLGGVDVEITPEHFPNKYLARSFQTLMIATRSIATPSNFEDEYQGIDGFLNESRSIVFGLPGSNGVVTARARVIRGEADVSSIQPGDVIVTESPSSLINLCLPYASAIVTDYGATLSHACVCARELGIPCVVGTKIATRTIKDGDMVEVNGSSGRVKIIKA